MSKPRRAVKIKCRLTGVLSVGIISNIKAILRLDERHVVAENAFVELVVWRIAKQPLSGRHAFKHRLALVVGGKCVVRYDNDPGKGEHRHVGRNEYP